MAGFIAYYASRLALGSISENTFALRNPPLLIAVNVAYNFFLLNLNEETQLSCRLKNEAHSSGDEVQ